jgi:hypothetical protein
MYVKQKLNSADDSEGGAPVKKCSMTNDEISPIGVCFFEFRISNFEFRYFRVSVLRYFNVQVGAAVDVFMQPK